MSGGHYLALASADVPGREEGGRERSGEVQEREGAREGTWDRVADRNPGSCAQVGGAMGVVSAEASEEPLQWAGE